MKFRRKGETAVDAPPIDDPAPSDDRGVLDGPLDSADLLPDEVQRVDLGSLWLTPGEAQELRIQIDEASGEVQSIVLAGAEGALDLRAFAASRNGDLWGEVRPKIVADFAQLGAVASEREGPFGTELIAQVTAEGNQTQITRIIGINGPRWLLRATLYGRPAVEPETAQEWEESIRRVVVHRGGHAVPPGEALPVTLPADARRTDLPAQSGSPELSD